MQVREGMLCFKHPLGKIAEWGYCAVVGTSIPAEGMGVTEPEAGGTQTITSITQESCVEVEDGETALTACLRVAVGGQCCLCWSTALKQ